MWTAISNGIQRHFADASILRVKDGEQALRFFLNRGLLTDAPEIPDLMVLASGLPVISVESMHLLIAR
jgi:hypothetical protein